MTRRWSETRRGPPGGWGSGPVSRQPCDQVQDAEASLHHQGHLLCANAHIHPLNPEQNLRLGPSSPAQSSHSFLSTLPSLLRSGGSLSHPLPAELLTGFSLSGVFTSVLVECCLGVDVTLACSKPANIWTDPDPESCSGTSGPSGTCGTCGTRSRCCWFHTLSNKDTCKQKQKWIRVKCSTDKVCQGEPARLVTTGFSRKT